MINTSRKKQPVPDRILPRLIIFSFSFIEIKNKLLKDQKKKKNGKYLTIDEKSDFYLKTTPTIRASRRRIHSKIEWKHFARKPVEKSIGTFGQEKKFCQFCSDGYLPNKYYEHMALGK